MSSRKLMKFGNVDTSMMLAPAREIMSQREGKHDKTDKVRQKRMPKKRERPVLLKYLLKTLR
jgi:hypothetical protein